MAPRVPPFLLRLSVGLGVIGGLTSLAIHVASLSGRSVSPLLTALLTAGMFVVFAPVVIELIRRAEREVGSPSGIADTVTHGFRLNVWLFRFLPVGERIVLGLLVLYTLVQFALGITQIAADPGMEGFPLPMQSAFWLYFYAVSGLFGRHLLATGSAHDDRQSH